MKNFRHLMAEAKFFSDYSRWNDEKGRYETWDEAVERVMNMHREFYADKMNDELSKYIDIAEENYKKKYALGAQRALQFGGTQILKHNMRLFNCLSTYADRPEFFGELMYTLLCGCGVGFSVQYHHVNRLPKIQYRTKQAKIFKVKDSIEGWAEAIDVLMSSFFVGGGKYPDYEGRRVYFDLTEIRPRGAPISGGFKAPGPDPLRLCLDRIEHLLNDLTLKHKIVKMKPIHVYDVSMFIADAVISGGVRRSATIALFSKDDKEMAASKTGNWFEDHPQRARSNNSVVLKRDEVTKDEFREIVENIKGFGEPGFFFTDNEDIVANPCVEISMYPQYNGQSGMQGCNLVEINGKAMTSKEMFWEACRSAAILGTLQAGYTNFKFVSDVTKKIFDKEALLGVSITGWMNNPDILFNKDVLKRGVEIIKKTNEEVAKLIGINPAARLTTTKPAGNVSILLECASGIHPEHSSMYIRNVQYNRDTEIAQLFMEKNTVMVEDSVWSTDGRDIVVSYPIVAPKNSIFKDDLTDIEFLEYVKKAQMWWVKEGTVEERCAVKNINHNVSNTVLVQDWERVTDYLFENKEYFTGVSLIPATGDKIYNQAPMTKILDTQEIVKKYGDGAIFASGLVVDGITAFGNIWTACAAVHSDKELEGLRKDWVRRFRKFAENYFDGDMEKTDHCLKDVHLWHKWTRIQRDAQDIDFLKELKKMRETEIDTMAAQACAGGACEI